MKIYLGCDLFVEGQRWQAIQVENALKEKWGNKVDIYNPASNMDINDKSTFSYGHEILLADYNQLKESDMLIALMDTEDTGLAAEMGMAWMMDIPIFQLYTDIRLDGNDNQEKHKQTSLDSFQNDIKYFNKLVTGLSYVSVTGFEYDKPTIFKNRQDLVDAVSDYIETN